MIDFLPNEYSSKASPRTLCGPLYPYNIQACIGCDGGCTYSCEQTCADYCDAKSGSYNCVGSCTGSCYVVSSISGTK